MIGANSDLPVRRKEAMDGEAITVGRDFMFLHFLVASFRKMMHEKRFHFMEHPGEAGRGQYITSTSIDIPHL